MAAGDPAAPFAEFAPFQPHPLVRGGHAQTLFPTFFPGARPAPGKVRHELVLSDGDRLILHDDTPAAWAAGGPAVLLLHGLAGCHSSSYMLRCARKMQACGWRVFRLDHRGSGSGRGLAATPYHAGRIDDLLAALRAVERECPASPLACVGFSLSGNLLLKLLANSSDNVPARLITGVAVCPSIDLRLAAENLRRRGNRIYDRHFASLLWRLAPQFRAVRERLPHCLRRANQPPSLYAFDELVTAPLGGFDGVEDYYRRASACGDLPRIRLSTLILASADDPLIPPQMFLKAACSPSTRLLLANAGGHLGFIGRGGVDPDRRWMDWRIIDWINRHMPGGRAAPSLGEKGSSHLVATEESIRPPTHGRARRN